MPGHVRHACYSTEFRSFCQCWDDLLKMHRFLNENVDYFLWDITVFYVKLYLDYYVIRYPADRSRSIDMSKENLVDVVTNDQFEMEYLKFGHGSDILVIVPGISLKPMALSAQMVIDGFVDFTEKYTIYLFDRINHMKPGYLVPDMAEDTVAAMKQLGIGKADFFGTSQGAMIVQTIAVKYPELVGKIVLGGTFVKNNPYSTKIFESWIALSDAADHEAIQENVFKNIYSPEFYKMFEDVFIDLGNSVTEAEFARFRILSEACLAYDGSADVAGIRGPIFSMYGAEDNVLGHGAAKELTELTGCETYVYPGGSHAVYDEVADFRPRMLAFLCK